MDGKPFTEVNGPIARPVHDEQDDGQIGYTYTGKGKGRAQALSQDLGEYGGQTSAIAMPQLSYVSASIFTSRDTHKLAPPRK